MKMDIYCLLYIENGNISYSHWKRRIARIYLYFILCWSGCLFGENV